MQSFAPSADLCVLCVEAFEKSRNCIFTTEDTEGTEENKKARD